MEEGGAVETLLMVFSWFRKPSRLLFTLMAESKPSLMLLSKLCSLVRYPGSGDERKSRGV